MIKVVGSLRTEKRKNGTKGDLVMVAHSVTKTINSLKIDKYMTAIAI